MLTNDHSNDHEGTLQHSLLALYRILVLNLNKDDAVIITETMLPVEGPPCYCRPDTDQENPDKCYSTERETSAGV